MTICIVALSPAGITPEEHVAVVPDREHTKPLLELLETQLKSAGNALLNTIPPAAAAPRLFTVTLYV